MKIGLVCPYDMFKGGGVQECILAMQAELTKRGHDVSIISPQPHGYTGAVPKKMVLLGTGKDVKSPFHTTAQLSVSLDPKELDAMLEREKFEVLHFHEPWVPIMSKQILSRSDAANVATFHAKLPDTVLSRAIGKMVTPYTKSVAKCLNEYAAVSEAAAEYIRSVGKKEPLIIPNGIDLKKYAYTDHRKVSDEPTIVYIGRLEQRKGVRHLLKAFDRLQAKNPKARLIIGGDGTDRQKLEQFVADKEIKNVTFEGFLTEKRKLELLKMADVFCSPALYGESFGIVLLEAMARGCVVLAGDNPGYRAVLRPKAKDSLVDPEDTHEFVRKLEAMLNNRAMREKWLVWAKEYVQQFSYENIVDQYEQMYKRVLRK